MVYTRPGPYGVRAVANDTAKDTAGDAPCLSNGRIDVCAVGAVRNVKLGNGVNTSYDTTRVNIVRGLVSNLKGGYLSAVITVGYFHSKIISAAPLVTEGTYDTAKRGVNIGVIAEYKGVSTLDLARVRAVLYLNVALGIISENTARAYAGVVVYSDVSGVFAVGDLCYKSRIVSACNSSYNSACVSTEVNAGCSR